MTKSHANSVPSSRRRAFRAPLFLLLAALLAGAFLLLSPAPGSAQSDNIVLLSNLGQSWSNTHGLDDNEWFAQSFTTGSTNSYWLSGVQLQTATFTAHDIDVTVTLRSDSNGSPSTEVLATFISPSSTIVGATEFPLASPVELQPNTKYWVRMAGHSNANPLRIDVTSTRDHDSNSLPGWSFALTCRHNLCDGTNPIAYQLSLRGTIGDPVVDIASDGDVAEGSDAVFTLTRGDTSGTLDVDVLVAETGGDMVAAGDERTHTVNFPAGAASAELRIATANDSPRIVDSEVTATIQTGDDYIVGADGAATVTVSDDDDIVLLSNLGQSNSNTHGLDDNEWFAQSFTTGSTSSYWLVGVQLQTATFAAHDIDVTVTLRPDVDGLPSLQVLATFISPSSTIVGATDFPLASPVELQPDTKYWVYMAGQSNADPLRIDVTSTRDHDSNSLPSWSFALTCTYNLCDGTNPIAYQLALRGGIGDPAISIASGGDVEEGSDAVFTLTRGDTSGTLDVDVLVSETGGDMVAARDERTHTVSFADGQASAELRIATADDRPRIVNSEVTATIQPVPGYVVVADGAATVRVSDDDGPPTAVSNLGLATDKTIALSNTALRVQGFTTGSRTGGYTLHSILVDFDKKPSSSGNLTVVLRSKDADTNNPSLTGSVTLTKPGNLGSPGTKTFTAPANTALTKETTYYVSITDGGSSNRGEVRTSSDDGEDSGALPGWSIGDDRHTYTAVDGWETSTDSILIAVRIAGTPDAPENPRSGIGADRLGLFWDAPLYDGGAAVTKYRHRHKASSAASWGTWTETADAATRSATITGLTAGTAYDFEVQARNAVGWGPAASVSAEPSTTKPRISIEALDKEVSDHSFRNRVEFRVSSDMAPASDLQVLIRIDEESDTRSDLGHSYGTSRNYTDIHAGDIISGSDQGPKTVTIKAGTTTGTHSISVQSDSVYEQDTTVTATIGNGARYVVGTPRSASVRVLDADMPVDSYPIDSDGNPRGYPYDYPGGYRDYAVDLVVGEDAGTVELRYECITWENRPHPHAPGFSTGTRGLSAVGSRDGTGDYVHFDRVETECMSIDNPGEWVFREGRWRYRNVVTVEVAIIDDDQYEGTEQFVVVMDRLAGTGQWIEIHEGKCGHGNVCNGEAGWVVTILDRGDAGAGLGPDGDGVYPPGSPQHHWIEVSNPEDPDSPGKFTSAATVTLKWRRPLSGGRHVDDTYFTRPVGGIAIEKYQIRHKQHSVATWSSWTDVAGISNPNAHPHEGGEFSASFDVSYGQLRMYEIRAVNVDDVEGAVLSTSVFVVKPPEAPTNVTAHAGNGKVELRWEDSSTPGVIIGGEVRWRRTTSDNSGTWSEWKLGGIGRGLVEGLQNGVSYDFQVRSYLAYGQGLPGGTSGTPQAPVGVRSDAPSGGTSNGKGLPSRVVRSTPKAGALLPSEGGPLAPAAPADLSAEAAGEGRIDLAWTAPEGEVTGYRVEWSPEGGTGWMAVDPPHAGLLPAYGHAGLAAGTTYRYRVQALNGSSSGPWSEVVSASTEEARPNRPASGAPIIVGTAKVGETLTADTSGIADEDGLANVSYRYQWLANDGTSEADISSATDSSYTLAGADLGKAVLVRVSFTDDRGHEETLSSAATGPVLAASPQQEPEPPGDETLVWSADMTVVDYETGAIGAGSADLFANQVSADNHRAKWLWAYTPDRQVYLALQTYIRDTEGLVLYIGGLALPFGDASGSYSDFTWDGVDVDWQDGQTLAARIARPGQVSEPVENTPATGLPTISGTAQVGETLTADTSSIADEDGLTSVSYSYQWQADGADIAGATDSTYTLVDSDEGKAVSVTVSFTDDAGNGETLTSEPTAAVAAIPNSAATGQPAISGTAQVGETLTADVSSIADADGLTNAVFSYQWLADGSDIAGATVSSYVLVDADEGKVISVTVSFTDDAGRAESLTSAATAAVEARPNSPATGLPTIGGTVQVGETLTADTSGISDEDGLDNVSYSYQWRAAGADISGATGSIYTLSDADEGRTITVAVSFSDDRGNSESLTSAATAAVLPKPNSPATGLPTISGTAQVGETLTADISGISDADGLNNATFSYQWVADGSDISGAPGSSYTLVDTDEGKTISVTVSFTDDGGNEESLTSEVTAAVEALQPDLALGLVVIAASPWGTYPGDTFNISAGLRNEGEGVSPATTLRYYQSADSNIDTSDTEVGTDYVSELAASESTSGESVELTAPSTSGTYHYGACVDVVAGESDTSNNCSSSIEFVVLAPNSPATGAPTISGTAQVGEVLTADTSGIADEDGLDNVSYSYQWQADGADMSGATDSTYTLADVDEGKTISVTVSFTDDRGNEESLTSAATGAVEAKPNSPATGLPTISGTVQVGEVLTADTSGIADEDGLDNATFSYQWQADGSDISGATGSSYTLVDSDEGKAISVTVSFTDDRGNSESLTSAATAAVAAKPNSPATGQPAISGTAHVGEALAADTSGIADEDGLASATFSYQWHADGSDIAGATDSTYTLVDADEGAAISVTVSFTDDAGNDESLTSAATAAVAARSNTPATGAPTISGTAQVGETLTADTSGIADEDGLNNATFSYQWQADGADISGGTGSSYTLADADEGAVISVTVSFTDDAGNEESLTSAATAAVAARPNTPATGAPTIDGTAQVGETLTADTSDLSDEDGLNNATFSYQWLADDADISGATGSSYTLVDSDEGKAISVTVSFTDDRGNSESLTSAATAAVAARPNSPATGLPTISGTAQVGETLTAETSGIADEDGLDNATFNYQWSADGTGIAGATDSTYILVDADEGKTISVTVSFTDDAGNAESLTSAATAAVVSAAPAPEPLTAVIANAPASHDGENTFTFDLRFSEEFAISFRTLRDRAFTVSRGDVKRAKRLEQGSNVGWRIHVRPDSNDAVTIILPVTTDCENQGAICTGDGRMLSSRLELTVSGP